MHEGSIVILLPADLKEIERLNRLVRQFGDLHEVPGRSLYSLNLALDEIMTNVVLHGFDGGAPTEHVQFRILAQDGQLQAQIEDGGRAFNPLDAPIPDLNAPLEEREIGGLGIHLVKNLMDRVEYRREGEKNVLTVRKRIR